MEHHQDCQRCHNKICARRVPIFNGMNGDEINKITDLIIRKVYRKGENIVAEGDYIDRLIIINTGKAKGCRYSIEGKEQILHLYCEGDFFGEKYLLIDKTATFNIEALEEVHVCMILKDDFRQLIKSYTEIGFKIMEELSIKLERLETTVEQMSTQSVEVRVMSALAEFADKFGEDERKGRMVILPLSREGIASYLGVTRETVSRSMNALQDEGLIEMVGNKKIFIPDVSQLRKSI